MSNATSQSRGDLGFIANSRYLGPNRVFFGSPGNPSKKGVQPLSTKLPETSEAEILTAENIVEKRTEYLESKERRLTATLNDQMSKYQELKETCDRLFEETQSIYGKVKTKLLGVKCEGNLELNTNQSFDDIASFGEWVYLCYPMKEVTTGNSKQCFMKCKKINKNTGQLTYHWALIYESSKDESTRYIEEFSLHP